MNYHDENYFNDRLAKLEGAMGATRPAEPKAKEPSENDLLRQENEMLKQRLKMAADPIRAEFEQSDEFRNAWMTNIVSFLYEANMAQWARSPYAQRLDEWTSMRIEEIRGSRQKTAQQPSKQAQTNAKAKTAQPSPNQDKED